MSDVTSPLSGFDLSGLTSAISNIQAITRPVMETLQNIQLTLQPIVEAFEKYKPNIVGIGQVLLKLSRHFSAIEKLGDAQFVFWDYMFEELVHEIADAVNINKTLREQLIRDRFSAVNKTIEKTLSSVVMQKHWKTFSRGLDIIIPSFIRRMDMIQSNMLIRDFAHHLRKLFYVFYIYGCLNSFFFSNNLLHVIYHSKVPP